MMNCLKKKKMNCLKEKGNISNVLKLIKDNDVSGLRHALQASRLKTYELHRGMTLVVTRGQAEMVPIFAKAGVRVNLAFCNGVPPLRQAAQHGNQAVMRELISVGADLNCRRESMCPLMDAALRGHLECVKLLVNSGCDVNKRSKFGTVLTLPHIGKHCDIIEYLIQHGADLKAVHTDGTTALMASTCYVQSLRTLLEAGADIDATDDRGRTVLFYAVRDYHMGSIQALLKFNPTVDLRDRSDMTPLIWTIKHFISGISTEAVGIAKTLIRYGCDVNFKGKLLPGSESELPLWIALRACAVPLAWMIWEAGGRAWDNGVTLQEPVTHFPVKMTFDGKWKHTCEIDKEVRKVMSQPRPLVGLCRIKIRGLLGCSAQQKLEHLSREVDLPPRIIKILHFTEFETIENCHNIIN